MRPSSERNTASSCLTSSSVTERGLAAYAMIRSRRLAGSDVASATKGCCSSSAAVGRADGSRCTTHRHRRDGPQGDMEPNAAEVRACQEVARSARAGTSPCGLNACCYSRYCAARAQRCGRRPCQGQARRTCRQAPTNALNVALNGPSNAGGGTARGMTNSARIGCRSAYGGCPTASCTAQGSYEHAAEQRHDCSQHSQ